MFWHRIWNHSSPFTNRISTSSSNQKRNPVKNWQNGITTIHTGITSSNLNALPETSYTSQQDLAYSHKKPIQSSLYLIYFLFSCPFRLDPLSWICFCHVGCLPIPPLASACNSNAIEYPAISMLDGPENQIMPGKVFLPDRTALVSKEVISPCAGVIHVPVVRLDWGFIQSYWMCCVEI